MSKARPVSRVFDDYMLTRKYQSRSPEADQNTKFRKSKTLSFWKHSEEVFFRTPRTDAFNVLEERLDAKCTTLFRTSESAMNSNGPETLIIECFSPTMYVLSVKIPLLTLVLFTKSSQD